MYFEIHLLKKRWWCRLSVEVSLVCVINQILHRGLVAESFTTGPELKTRPVGRRTAHGKVWHLLRTAVRAELSSALRGGSEFCLLTSSPVLDAEATPMGTGVFFLSFQNKETLGGREVLFPHFEEEEAEPQREAPSHPVGGGRHGARAGERRSWRPLGHSRSLPPCLPRFPECPLCAWHNKGAGSLLPEGVLDVTMVRIFLNL